MDLESERIEYAIRASGHNPKQIAEKIGIEPAAVYQWIKKITPENPNPPTRPSQKNYRILSNLTNFSIDWLTEKKGPMKVQLNIHGRELEKDEIEWLELYRSMDKSSRECAKTILSK